MKRLQFHGTHAWVLTRFMDTMTLWEPLMRDGELVFKAVYRTHRPFDYDELLRRVTM